MAITTWEQLVALPNAVLKVLVEITAPIKYEVGTDWTSEGDDTYSHACPEINANETLTDDGVELTLVASVALCKSTAGSFYFDYTAQTIYVHCSDDYDLRSGSAPYPVIMVYASKYFSTENVEFNGHPYKAYVPQDGLSNIDLSVDDVVEGAYKYNFGTFKLTNSDFWFNSVADTYCWTNAKVVIRVGGESLLYSEYKVYFVGRISDFDIMDEEIIFSVNDIRIDSFGQLPLAVYDITTYPDLDPDAEGKPIPIFYGVKTNIIPVCIDTTALTFKIAESREIKEVTAVRKNGFALTVTTHYTVDLANAEITLLIPFHFDDGDILEVDAKGIVDGSDDLIIKGGAIAKDILKTYLGYVDADLDLTSFTATDAARSYELCIYLDTMQSSREVLQTISRSIVAFLCPTEDGKLSFEAYTVDVPSNILDLYDYDYESWKVIKDSSFVRNKVAVRYNMNPRTQIYEEVIKENTEVKYKYGIKDVLNLDTYLRIKADAENVRDAISDMCSKPLTVVETEVGLKGFRLFPTRKVRFTKADAPDSTGEFVQKVFRIRQIVKDSSNEATKLVAMDDLQSIGGDLCTDCYSCQVCVTCDYPCELCYSCEICVADQGGCQVCYTCELCDTTQGGCIDCNTCELCDTCQVSAGACQTCQECYVCELCNNCQGTVNTCTSCQDCVTCELNVATCQTCQVCDVCDRCFSCEGECEECEWCVTCQYAPG